MALVSKFYLLESHEALIICWLPLHLKESRGQIRNVSWALVSKKPHKKQEINIQKRTDEDWQTGGGDCYSDWLGLHASYLWGWCKICVIHLTFLFCGCATLLCISAPAKLVLCSLTGMKVSTVGGWVCTGSLGWGLHLSPGLPVTPPPCRANSNGTHNCSSPKLTTALTPAFIYGVIKEPEAIADICLLRPVDA